jgi:hypothetical protein
MMECVLTNREVDALRDLLPNVFTKDGSKVDYRALEGILLGDSSRLEAGGGNFPLPLRSSQSHWTLGSGSGTLRPRMSANTPLRLRDSVPTPATATATLRTSQATPGTHRIRRMGTGRIDVERVLAVLAERVLAATRQGSQSMSPRHFLVDQFEYLDKSHSGLALGDDFERALRDIGVDLNDEEVEAVIQRFGADDELIDYIAFCYWIDDHNRTSSHLQNTATRASASRNRGDYEEFEQTGRRGRWARSPMRRRPPAAEDMYDQRVSREYRNQEYGQYEHDNEYSNYWNSLAPPKVTDSMSSGIYGPGYGGYGQGNPWTRSREREPFSDRPYNYDDAVHRSYDSRGSTRYNGNSWDMQSPSRSAYRASDDFRDRDQGGGSPWGTRGRSTSTSPGKSAIRDPRASPSRVGTIMWGNDTPLSEKGKLPRADSTSDRWCCAVCMYTENPRGTVKCGVCDSMNYATRKVRGRPHQFRMIILVAVV